jgi:hypothetical protein
MPAPACGKPWPVKGRIMSDHDATPDPIDTAYVQAEAVLSDEAARAARRARVLAAVASEAALAAPVPFTRRSTWRRGRWLAAAGVAGLGLILATQIYPPAWRQPRTASNTPTPKASAPAAEGIAASPPPPTVAPSPEPPPRPALARVPQPIPPPLVEPPVVSPPPPAYSAPTPQAFPEAAPPPPPPSRESVIVTAERRSSREAMVDQDASRAADAAAPPMAASGFATAPSDQAARLRAAAAAGRTAEVKALLVRGVPVDAPDADGKTALMKSIQAAHPAVAALLRRHGASLDNEDNAGESARDMAAAKGDPALDQALGLAP